LLLFPPERTLLELESWVAFRELGPASYPLAYFAVAELLEEHSLYAVRDYYESLAAGRPALLASRTAFGHAFGDHYGTVEAEIAMLNGAAAVSGDAPLYEGTAQKSPVRPAGIPATVAIDE
jgi:hypothetical protein